MPAPGFWKKHHDGMHDLLWEIQRDMISTGSVDVPWHDQLSEDAWEPIWENLWDEQILLVERSKGIDGAITFGSLLASCLALEEMAKREAEELAS
jgi:hypothetical protein